MIHSPAPSRMVSMKEMFPFCGRAAFFNLVESICRSMCPVNSMQPVNTDCDTNGPQY